MYADFAALVCRISDTARSNSTMGVTNSWLAIEPSSSKRKPRHKDCLDSWLADLIRSLRLSVGPGASGASLGPTDGSHLATAPAAAEEPIITIRLEPRHANARRHLEPLQNLTRSGIDSPHVAVVTFPGSVPQLAVDPGDPGHDAIGLDGPKNRSRFWIDLMNLAAPMLPDPERP